MDGKTAPIISNVCVNPAAKPVKPSFPDIDMNCSRNDQSEGFFIGTVERLYFSGTALSGTSCPYRVCCSASTLGYQRPFYNLIGCSRTIAYINHSRRLPNYSNDNNVILSLSNIHHRFALMFGIEVT